MLRVVLVQCPDVLEKLAISLVSKALDKPVDGRVEQTLILVGWEVFMALLDHVVVEFEHVLDHE